MILHVKYTRSRDADAGHCKSCARQLHLAAATMLKCTIIHNKYQHAPPLGRCSTHECMHEQQRRQSMQAT